MEGNGVSLVGRTPAVLDQTGDDEHLASANGTAERIDIAHQGRGGGVETYGTPNDRINEGSNTRIGDRTVLPSTDNRVKFRLELPGKLS